jgi:MFS family permease
MVAALLGAVAGIGLIVVIPTEAAFALAGGVYVLGGLVARGISLPLAHPVGQHAPVGEAVVQVGRDLFDGLRVIWNSVQARLPLIGIFLLRTLAMFVVVSAILIIKNSFGEGERVGRLSSSALALGSAGLGAFVGALTAPLLGTRLRRGGLVLFGFAISSAAIVMLGGIADIYALIPLTFVGGLGGFVTKVAVDASVQEALPDEYRGRAFALYDILYNLASVVAGVLMVLTYDPTRPQGLRAVMVVTGFVGLSLTGLLARAFRSAGIPLSNSDANPAQGTR